LVFLDFSVVTAIAFSKDKRPALVVDIRVNFKKILPFLSDKQLLSRQYLAA